MIAPEILFQDQRFIVINKPAGLPVHASRGGGPNVEDFFPALSRAKSGPWLAHRLDRDTAGCLVIALRKSALLAAQALFAGGKVSKTYWALVAGTPGQSKGEIDLPLAKITTGKGWKMGASAGAAAAFTSWRLLGSGPGHSWLELYPRSGRTHQIRAHCAAIGHPILGDRVYGGGEGALCLLARAIMLPLEPAVAAIAPAPPHMLEGLKSAAGRNMIRSEFEPGTYVRHPKKPEWGLGQVQSAIGERVTVMFEHAGKVVVNSSQVALDRLDGPD